MANVGPGLPPGVAAIEKRPRWAVAAKVTVKGGPFGGQSVGVAPVGGEPSPVAAGVALPDRDQAMDAGRNVDDNAAAEVVGRVKGRVAGVDCDVVVPWREGGDRHPGAAAVAGGVEEDKVPLEATQRRFRPLDGIEVQEHEIGVVDGAERLEESLVGEGGAGHVGR